MLLLIPNVTKSIEMMSALQIDVLPTIRSNFEPKTRNLRYHPAEIPTYTLSYKHNFSLICNSEFAPVFFPMKPKKNISSQRASTVRMAPPLLDAHRAVGYHLTSDSADLHTP